MATRFCSHCGRPVAPGAGFCSSCGAPVAGGAAPTAVPGTAYPPPPGAQPYAPYPTYPVPGAGPGWNAPTFGPADHAALSDVFLAAMIALIGIALSIAELFTSAASNLFNVTSVGSGSSVTVDLTALYVAAALGVVGVVLFLLGVWFYRRAFRTLAPQDARFSTPATLTLLLFIAVILLIGILAAFFAVFFQAAQCAGSGNAITSACIDVGTVLGLIAGLFVLLIVALVGAIGLLIGIWRLGTRYNEGLFKAGAILLIFPVVSVVGIILILLAAHSVRSKIQSGPPAMPFG
jgi:uncharacterized membrane protein